MKKRNRKKRKAAVAAKKKKEKKNDGVRNEEGGGLCTPGFLVRLRWLAAVLSHYCDPASVFVREWRRGTCKISMQITAHC